MPNITLAPAPATRADSPPPDRPTTRVVEDAGSRWRTWRWRCQCGKPVPGPFDPTFATEGHATRAAVRHVTEHHPEPGGFERLYAEQLELVRR